MTRSPVVGVVEPGSTSGCWISAARWGAGSEGSAPRFPHPRLLLEAARAPDGCPPKGPDAARAAEFARRFLAFHGLAGGARLVVHQRIPAHSGLGSGTQLGLAVARALAELYGLPPEPADAGPRGLPGPALGHRDLGVRARRVHRGRRPAPGRGRHRAADRPVRGAGAGGAVSWRSLRESPGLSGEAEAAAFERLPPPAEAEVERVSHLVLMQLLPALVESGPARASARRCRQSSGSPGAGSRRSRGECSLPARVRR